MLSSFLRGILSTTWFDSYKKWFDEVADKTTLAVCTIRNGSGGVVSEGSVFQFFHSQGWLEGVNN
jgi:hypothetical protein